MAYSAKWGGYEIVTDPESGTTYSCGKGFIENKFITGEYDGIVAAATNTTSADVYLYDDSQSKYYVFKTFCPDRITAYYSPSSPNTEIKLLGNAERVWSEEIDCDVVETDSTTGDEIVIPYKMALLSNSGYTSERVTSYTFKNTNEKKCKYAVLPSVGDDLLGVMPVGMFKGCTELTKVKIPCNIESIPNDAFSGCTSLTSCTNGMDTMEHNSMDFIVNIGDKAFAECTSLTEAVIGKNVMSLGDGCFSGCTSISAITYDASAGTNAELSPDNRLKAIPEKAFLGCSRLSSAKYYDYQSHGFVDDNEKYLIPSNVETIGKRAFYGCENINSIEIPYASIPSLKEIGEEAFIGCDNLTTFNVLHASSNELKIGDKCCSGCSNITKIVLPSYVASIGDMAFKNTVINSGSIEFPSSVGSIGNQAFMGCSGATFKDTTLLSMGITVSSGVGLNAFSQCSGLNLPLDIKADKIDNHGFAQCSSLPSINVETTNESYGLQEGAFRECSAVSALTATTSNIGPLCFYKCSGLTSAVINGNMISGKTSLTICSKSFSGCSNLTSVTISADAIKTDDASTTIGPFSGLDKISNIIIETSSPNTAFEYASNLFVGGVSSATTVTLNASSKIYYLDRAFPTTVPLNFQVLNASAELINNYNESYASPWTFTAITTN